MELALSLPLKAFVVAFTIAVAVGPITLLVIRRTIDHGGIYGFASGMGVAAADATYGGIAAFGLTAVTSVLVANKAVLGLVGGVVIILAGVRIALARQTAPVLDGERPGLAGAFGSIYLLTMTNPLTILLYAGVFAGIGLAGSSSFVDAAIVTFAVWLGSALWWVLLCSALAWLRRRVSARALLWLNRISGAALAVFGALAVIAALRQ